MCPWTTETTHAGQENRPPPLSHRPRPARTRVASDRQLPYLLSPLPTQDLAAHQTRSPDQVHRRWESNERLQPPSDPRRRPSHLSEPSPKPSGSGQALLQPARSHLGALPVPHQGSLERQVQKQIGVASGTYSPAEGVVGSYAGSKLHVRSSQNQ